MNDEMKTVTIFELLTLKYLTTEIPPFRPCYKQFLKNLNVEVLDDAPKVLKDLADELVVRFILIFIRDHRDTWMRFEKEPLSNLFSSEELKTISDRFGMDSYATAIIRLDRWLSRRFQQSLTKEEMEVLVTDFEKCLNDARELIISAQSFYTAIRAGLKTGTLSGEEVIEFLDSNKEATEPMAYDRSINFLTKLPSDQQKYLADSLVPERNYLQWRGLLTHLHRIEEAMMERYFLKTITAHTAKLARAVGERAGERIAWAYEVYYSILGKFKRQPKAHFEHYLNATLLGERKHALSDREKTIYRDDVTCPFCGCALVDILKGKTRGSIECPFCHVFIGVEAFENDLILISEEPDSFFRDPFETKGPTYRVRTFTPTIGEVDFSDLLDRLLLVNPVLTNKEGEVVEAIREADGEGVSMSKVLRRIAAEQGKSEHTLSEHKKNAVKKLKKLAKKGK